MAVRSRRFFGPVRTGASAWTTLYTVPAGRTAIFRSLIVSNPADTVAWPYFLRTGAGATGTGAMYNGTLPGAGFVSLPYMVLNPGDKLFARSNATGSPGVDCYGFGTLLSGEPE